MAADRLVTMANQIGRFFAHRGPNAAEPIAAHIRAFWDPRMRAAILAHVAAGGAGLDPITKAALDRLVADSRPAMITDPP